MTAINSDVSRKKINAKGSQYAWILAKFLDQGYIVRRSLPM